jgi:hypothetical protein
MQNIAAAAVDETVACVDPSGTWKVNFSLNGKIVSDIHFLFLDQITATYPKMKANVHRLNGKTYYDMNFDENTYMDFMRVNGTNQLNGAFFIYQNPTGMEVNISCEAN